MPHKGMSKVLTLVASKGNPDLTQTHFESVAACFNQSVGHVNWLSHNRAGQIELSLDNTPDMEVIQKLRDSLKNSKIDFFISAPEEGARLFVFDFDSTLSSKEGIDEIARRIGKYEDIKRITDKAMEEGENLNFTESLLRRLSLLTKVHQSHIDDLAASVLNELNPGVDTFIRTIQKLSPEDKIVIVSGGFVYFTSVVHGHYDLHAHHSNELEFNAEGHLTGNVTPGSIIIDGAKKKEILIRTAQELNIPLTRVFAMGDGSNDIPMLKEAGNGIGYRAKDAVKKIIPMQIIHGDFTTLLYYLGIPEDQFALEP